MIGSTCSYEVWFSGVPANPPSCALSPTEVICLPRRLDRDRPRRKPQHAATQTGPFVLEPPPNLNLVPTYRPTNECQSEHPPSWDVVDTSVVPTRTLRHHEYSGSDIADHPIDPLRKPFPGNRAAPDDAPVAVGELLGFEAERLGDLPCPEGPR